MILIIRGCEASRHRDVLEELYRLRYRCFVGQRRWSLPTRDGMEIDQYDTADATYFLVCDAQRTILAAVRIHQTSKASFLADFFPSLIETGEADRGDWLYEGTRYLINPEVRAPALIRTVRAELNCAAAEWMMAEGGRQSQAVVDFKAYQGFLAMSLRARPLGLPQDYGGGPGITGGGRCIAFRWDLSRDLIEDFRAYGEGVRVRNGKDGDVVH